MNRFSLRYESDSKPLLDWVSYDLRFWLALACVVLCLPVHGANQVELDGCQPGDDSSLVQPESHLFRYGRSVGALVTFYGDDTIHRGVAIRVGANHVLVASHTVGIPQALEGWRYIADAGEMSQKRNGGMRFDLSEVISSHRGHIDYLLLKLAGTDNFLSDGNTLMAAYAPASLGDALSGGDRRGYVLGRANYPKNSNSLLLTDVCFLGMHRYIKSSGTSISIDYNGEVIDGMSGGIILDAEKRWIGIHSRSLNKAIDETGTSWSPYMDNFYPRYRRVDTRNGIRYMEPDIKQGTLLVDIVDDLLKKKGLAWVFKHTQSFARIALDLDSQRPRSYYKDAASGDTAIDGKGSDSNPR
jgi:hypothetical protein